MPGADVLIADIIRGIIESVRLLLLPISPQRCCRFLFIIEPFLYISI